TSFNWRALAFAASALAASAAFRAFNCSVVRSAPESVVPPPPPPAVPPAPPAPDGWTPISFPSGLSGVGGFMATLGCAPRVGGGPAPPSPPTRVQRPKLG